MEHNGRLNDADFYTYEVIAEIADWLLKRTVIRPRIGIICGTGMSELADMLEEPKAFDYKDIPNFPVSTVAGHKGKLIFGRLNDVQVVCMQGRFHPYEGYSMAKCSMPVRVMKLCGATHLIASNAAGALNQQYQEGDIMILKDHLNIMGFAGNGPLVGPNDERFGPRFPPMDGVYDSRLRRFAKEIAREGGLQVKEGVYTAIRGPNYETVADVKFFQTFGVDAIGMSTVHEVIAARHAGMTVFAFSLITNVCQAEYEDEKTSNGPNHQDILGVGQRNKKKVALWITELVARIGRTTKDSA